MNWLKLKCKGILFLILLFAFAESGFSQVTPVQPKFKTVYIPVKKTTPSKRKAKAAPVAAVIPDSLIRANDSLRFLFFEAQSQNLLKDSLIGELRQKIADMKSEVEKSEKQLATVQAVNAERTRNTNFLLGITIVSVLLFIISLILFLKEKNRNNKTTSKPSEPTEIVKPVKIKEAKAIIPPPIESAIPKIENPVPVPQPDVTATKPLPQFSPPPADINSRLDQLEHLGKMREKGILSEEEFNTQKKRLLGLRD